MASIPLPDLKLVSEELSQHIDVNRLTSKPLETISTSIESAKTQTVELNSVMEQILEETTTAAPILSALSHSASKLEDIFEQIDSIEQFVAHVKQNLSQVEHHVNETERAMSKPLLPFKLPTSTSEPNLRRIYFPPLQYVEVFRAKEFFGENQKENEE